MNVSRGRARRPDDWPSSHVRARADLSERLDLPLEPEEATWLEAHLEACPECRAIADAYTAQRLELRSLRDRMPPPPRDLWARTAAAIESESRFRDGRARSAGWRDRRYLAPSALLAAALVVAVAAGTWTSSLRSPGDGATGSSDVIAVASGTATDAAGGGGAGATPIPAPRTFAYLALDADGAYTLKTKSIAEVCPPAATGPCATDATVEDHPVALDQHATTVFGSPDDERLIVVNDPTSANSGTVSVVSLASAAPTAPSTPTPSPTPSVASPSVTPSASATPSVGPPSNAPPSSPPPSTPPPSQAPSPSAGGSPSPSVAVTPTLGGPIQIAHDVVLVGQSAAYSSSGRWFAFTARPEDGSTGPDIYVWKVGQPLADPVTTDHRSVFGSWLGDTVVGSTVVTDLEPASFLLDPATAEITALPQTGRAWRPAVDPRGRLAVYWAGTVRATEQPGFAPDAGRLVLGDWGTGTSTPSGAPAPTALSGDQIVVRHETTIAAGRMNDWDARWDSTGTHLAIWIADPQNAAVGRLSLYSVDSFDGRIDLKAPLLESKIAAAGFAISEGKLVWAEPSEDGTATGGKVQLLAWTDEGVGTVETVTGPVIVIR